MGINYEIIITSFLIYSYFFYNLGNTIFRIDNEGIKKFNLSSLFIEGFIGPLRTGYLLLKYNIKGFLPFIYFEMFRLSNPYSAFIFTFYLYNVIKQNI